MKIRNLRYWSLVLMGTVLALFMPTGQSGEALARGGGGRGGGGGGRGGGGAGRGGRGAGAAGRAAAAAASRGGGGRNGKNSNNKKEQEEDRREERMARVAEARLLYAQRERENMWEDESQDRFAAMLRRVLDGSSE